MSEVAHDNWKNVKTIYRFHELVFYIWDNHLECFNRDTRDIELEASCSQIPYEQKTILCRVFTRRDNETGRVHGPWLSIMVSQLFTYQRRIQGGGVAPGARPPLKLGKIWFFGVKSWFFIRNTTQIFAPPSARRNFFKCAPPPLLEILDPPLCIVVSNSSWLMSKMVGALYETGTTYPL